MRCAIIYSSVTGNTKLLAEAIYEVMPEGCSIFPVQKAPAPDEFDFIGLGFWGFRTSPDPRMLRYMQSVQNKTVAWFGTLAAWPDSPHALQTGKSAADALAGNTILGGFICQGKLAPKRLENRLHSTGSDSASHPMTEERRIRLMEANKHPDTGDLQAAQETFKAFAALAQSQNIDAAQHARKVVVSKLGKVTGIPMAI